MSDVNLSIAACQWGAAIGASLAAALLDLKTQRIPNWLTLPLAAVGLAVAGWAGGLPGAGHAMAASLLVALPYMVLFFLGQGGAGDAKPLR